MLIGALLAVGFCFLLLFIFPDQDQSSLFNLVVLMAGGLVHLWCTRAIAAKLGVTLPALRRAVELPQPGLLGAKGSPHSPMSFLRIVFLLVATVSPIVAEASRA